MNQAITAVFSRSGFAGYYLGKVRVILLGERGSRPGMPGTHSLPMKKNSAPPQDYSWSVAKRFCFFFLFAVALFAFIVATFYAVTIRTERIERKTSELLNLQLGKTAIARELENIISDLMFLARLHELQGMFESGNPELGSVMARQFLVFSRQKRKYDQTRLLDRTGREIIRVNYNNGNPKIIPKTQLQDKSGRYYFTKTWALTRGNVYISPLDLNIENGRIERPLKPMIRLGTPVFDNSGRKSGILLLNYLGEILIRDFRAATANIAESTMLLNADGYWLSSPRPDDEWGFMYGEGRTFEKVHPKAWKRILAGDTGQFYDDEGLFSFTTIYPLLRSSGGAKANGGDGSPITDKAYYWKAVSYVPLANLTATPLDFIREYQLLYGAILGLLAVASLLLAHASVRHKQTVLQVEFERRFRSRLEEMVEKRTQELIDTQSEKDLVVQQLIQAEKMAALGTMASGIGHEINNPLYAILGRGEAIRDEEDIHLCRGYGQDIINYTKQIAETVKSLAGYARPAGEHDLQPVDINEKLSEALSLTKLSVQCDHVKIVKKLGSVAKISAKGEEIQQVFFNIIRNAIQAMKEEGTLEITSLQDNERVVIRIRDTGVGISAEHQGKIFDPFFTTKGPDEGEGLGLFIVQQIVKKYSGKISFESRKGTGTVCTIEFPIGEKYGEETLK